MRPRLLTAIGAVAAGLALPVLAQEDTQPAPLAPPLSATEFDTLTRGKVMDHHDMTGRYGAEEYLPGRRHLAGRRRLHARPEARGGRADLFHL